MKVTIEFESLEAAAAALGKVLVNQADTPAAIVPQVVVEAAPAVATPVTEPEKPKRKRRTKAEIAAAKKAEATPAVEEDDPFADTNEEGSDDADIFGLDDDAEPAPVVVTVEQVRKALINYKEAFVKKAVAGGMPEAEATTNGMDSARKILNKVAGTVVLSEVTADKYAAIVAEAAARTAKLA